MPALLAIPTSQLLPQPLPWQRYTVSPGLAKTWVIVLAYVSTMARLIIKSTSLLSHLAAHLGHYNLHSTLRMAMQELALAHPAETLVRHCYL